MKFDLEQFHMQSVPAIKSMVVRRPKPHEHPLTLDVRIGNSDAYTLETVLRRWRQAIHDMGTVSLPLTEEQEYIKHEFWSMFDESCYVDSHVPTDNDHVEILYSYYKTDHDPLENTKQIEWVVRDGIEDTLPRD